MRGCKKGWCLYDDQGPASGRRREMGWAWIAASSRAISKKYAKLSRRAECAIRRNSAASTSI